MHRVTSTFRSGQAAPELMGIVVVVALMVGALALVLQSWHVPAHPPSLLDGAARPLYDTPRPVSAPAAPSIGDAVATPRSDPPWYLRYPSAFGRGLTDRGRMRVRQVVRDPIGTAKASLMALNPIQMVRDGRSGSGRLIRRLAEYRGMDRDDAVEALLYDLGGFAFDAGMRRVGVKVARGGARRVRDRTGRSPAGVGGADDQRSTPER